MAEELPELEFDCKRDGCTERVRYRPMLVPGALKRSPARGPAKAVVYLRCGLGHIHPYTVERPAVPSDR